MASAVLARTRPPPKSPLFPYTTLFRSRRCGGWPLGHPNKDLPMLSEIERVLDRERVPVVVEVHEEVRAARSEEHTSELQSLTNLVCRLLLDNKILRFPQSEIEIDEIGV